MEPRCGYGRSFRPTGHGLPRDWPPFSAESRYLRFLRPVDHLSNEELTYLTEIDYRTHFAWGAELARGREQPGIGLARYVCPPDDPTIAEAAVAVLDEYQGRGLGGILLSLLAESALENGVERFRSYVLSDNRKVLAALAEPGIERRDEENMIRFDIPLPLACSCRSRFRPLRNAASCGARRSRDSTAPPVDRLSRTRLARFEQTLPAELSERMQPIRRPLRSRCDRANTGRSSQPDG